MTKREEIKILLQTHEIDTGWLANRLDLKSSTLRYLLNDSPAFDDELYNRIKEIVAAYQYELKLFDQEPTDNYNLFDDDKFQLGIGERIRIFAKRRYGTLKKLADAMDISPQQLQQYISGKREPGSKILAKLLRLGCDVNWLLGGSESVESYKIYKLESELKRLQNAVSTISKVVHNLE